MSTPVSDCKAVRAAGSGSLAQIDSAGASPARIIPLIKAVAILPEPMKPQRHAATTSHWSTILPSLTHDLAEIRPRACNDSRTSTSNRPRAFSAERRPFEHLGIDDVLGQQPPRGPEHPLGHRPAGRPPDVRGRRRPVRRQDHIVQLEQRIVERQRLDLEDIEAGAGDPPLAQRGRQRRLVDQLAPADVDEVRRRLHQRQLRRADQAAGRVGQPAVQADEVRLGAAPPRARSARTPSVARDGRVGVRRIGDDPHLERRDQPHQLAAAVPQADDARASGPGSRRPSPTAWRSQRPCRTIRSWSGSRLARASMNSSADDAVEWFERHRRVEDRHAVLGAGGQVDLVVAGARAADHDQVAGARGERAPLDPGPQDDQAVDVRGCAPA